MKIRLDSIIMKNNNNIKNEEVYCLSDIRHIAIMDENGTITKKNYIGPIAALEYVPSINCLLVASGPQLSCYYTFEKIWSFEAFHSHTISGVTYLEDWKVVIFGWKYVSILGIKGSPKRLVDLGPLPDLVLETHYIPDYRRLIVGYAQHFLEIFDVTTGLRIFSLQLPLVCVLFSFAISPNTENSFTLSSGTAFGKIVLWDFKLETNNNSPLSYSANMKYILNGHEGVVFRMKWSKSGHYLASVSDDRTVRLWDTILGTCIFVGWGHKCRVWDVVFASNSCNENEENLLITCGEDATIKVWDWTRDLQAEKTTNTSESIGSCVCTISGHAGRSIWRLSTMVDDGMGAMNLVVISGGNDGSVKFWPLQMHMNTNAEIDISDQKNDDEDIVSVTRDGRQFMVSSVVPPWPGLVMEKNKRRGAGVMCKVNPSGTVAVVVLIEGAVWLVDLVELNRSSNAEYNANQIWWRGGVCDYNITSADVCFTTDAQNEEIVNIVCVHPSRLASTFQCPSLNQTRRMNDFQQPHITVWTVHETKAVSVWWLVGSSCNVPPSRVVTASMGGACCVWAKHCNKDTSESCMTMLAEMQTSNGSIASCVVDVDLPRGKGVIGVGDTRGGLVVYSYTHLFGAQGSIYEFQLVHTYRRLHDVESVSCIKAIPHTGFCSLGHDGTMAIFKCKLVGEEISISLLQQLKCSPISLPDQIIIHGSGNLQSIYIAGYHSSEFFVWDVRRGYQVCRVSSGGWKRPHSSSISFPAENLLPSNFSYVYLAPRKSEKDTVLKCLLYQPLTFTPSSLSQASDRPVPASISPNRVPVQLGISSLGRVGYCASFLPLTNEIAERKQIQLLAVAGEDAIIKIFHKDESSNGFNYFQDCQMPGNVQIRCVKSVESLDKPGSGVMLAAGGRLMFAIWHYDVNEWDCEYSLIALTHSGCFSDSSRSGKSKSMRTGKQCHSSGGQDHRILSCDAVSLDRDHFKTHSDTSELLDATFVALFCDSRGIATLLVIHDSPREDLRSTNVALDRFKILDQFLATPAGSPLLSCVLIPIKRDDGSGSSAVMHVAALGDSSGGITVWLLPLSGMGVQM